MSNPYGHTSLEEEDAKLEFVRVASQVKMIGLGLLMGCVMFACIALLINGFSTEIYEGASIVSWMAVCMGCMMFVTSMIMPNVIVKSQLGRGHTVSSLCGLFKTRSVIGMAMSEGAAFFNCIAYILDAQLMNLGVVSLLLIQIAMRIPSAFSVESWVTEKQRVS